MSLGTFWSYYIFSFDIICITETRLHDQTPLVDINIDGYDFLHTETMSQNGGAALYIRSHFEYEKINDLSVSIKDICEIIFIEIKGKNNKKNSWVYLSSPHNYWGIF